MLESEIYQQSINNLYYANAFTFVNALTKYQDIENENQTLKIGAMNYFQNHMKLHTETYLEDAQEGKDIKSNSEKELKELQKLNDTLKRVKDLKNQAYSKLLKKYKKEYKNDITYLNYLLYLHICSLKYDIYPNEKLLPVIKQKAILDLYDIIDNKSEEVRNALKTIS